MPSVVRQQSAPPHPLPPDDAVAIDMPLTADAVAIYLGIVLAGCAAVSIAGAQGRTSRHLFTGALHLALHRSAAGLAR